MKILHISDQPPGYKSGGQLGILQFSHAWTRVGTEVDYVGPKFEDEEIKSWYHRVFFLDRKLSTLEKISSVLVCQFDRKYMSWKKMNIDFGQYDLIYIDFTKMAYALKDIRNAGYRSRIIVRAHNVEEDFFRINYLSNKTIINYIKYKLARPREKFMVRNADCILAITDQDATRLMDLYKVSANKIKVCPVGVKRSISKMRESVHSRNVLRCLITGSLWFGPNVEATLWLLKEVYPEVRAICNLTVAGFKPNDKLRKMCAELNVRLVDSPESMESFFCEADMVLAPVFDGGGMKVKVAEAMSFGLPVITTTHGAIGYQLVNGENGYIADEKKDFINCIQEYNALSNEKKELFKNRVLDTYFRNYSYQAIEDICRETADFMLRANDDGGK